MTELVGLILNREVDRLRTFFADNPRQPEGWQDTVSLTTSSFWATADEMRELVETVTHLIDRFAGRQHDASLRPEGARPARLLAAVNPESYPTDPPDAATADAPENSEDQP